MWQAFRRSKKNECSRTRDVLSGYMDRRLNPEETARVEEHLSTCQGCREEVESLRATVALLRSLPEVTPSRSFAVVPVRAMPGRRALPAMRFAIAGAALLLVLAFAADQTNLLERRGDIISYSYSADVSLSEGDESYWLVEGARNDIAEPMTVTADVVKLVVPDGTDNVSAAVDSLATEGVVYGTIESGQDEVPQLVLVEDESDAVGRGELTQFTVLSASDAKQSPFATNNAEASALDSIIEGQDGSYFNILSSDNRVLYSFDLSEPQRAVKASGENEWLRPLEYGLIGLVAVLATATFALWFRRKRARAVEVNKG